MTLFVAMYISLWLVYSVLTARFVWFWQVLSFLRINGKCKRSRSQVEIGNQDG
jgi:hypothetical protein